MISRKIWKELQNFRSKNGTEALLVDGARQVGKTYIVRQFAKRYYKNFIELNFIKNPAAKTLFEGVWDEKEFFVKLSALTPQPLVSGETPQYMDGIQLELLNGRIDINCGAVFENFVAQELTAHGYEHLYYFNSKKHGEVDFLVERGGVALPIEVKSGSDYKSHAALNNMMSVSDYGLSRAVVYTAHGEIGNGPVAYVPIYALMLLERDSLSDGAVYKLEL